MNLNIEHWSALIVAPPSTASETLPDSASLIDQLSANFGACSNVSFLHDQSDIPATETVPKMQRRRLSALAKMVFSQIDSLSNATETDTVFSTRHGDLPKTVELIRGVAEKEDLSPTAFALSVHNAIAGQYGILLKNRQPSTVVSAGKDTFHQALIEAYARLMSGQDDSIALIHADMPLPECYSEFQDEVQIPHCVVLVLNRSQGPGSFVVKQQTAPKPKPGTRQFPQAVEVCQFLASGVCSSDIQGERLWSWTRV